MYAYMPMHMPHRPKGSTVELLEVTAMHQCLEKVMLSQLEAQEFCKGYAWTLF